MNTTPKKKVLVVDDDSNLRNILVDALNTSGFEAMSASDGEEGLHKAFELHPDAIILDVMMPKMNGWQVLENIRMDNWGKDAKILMLTSLGQMDDVAHALDKQVFTYIIKSELDLNNITETINNLIKNPSI